MALPADFQASVIAACANPLPCNVVSQHGKRVIKISDHQVVKWGPDVTEEEAENQKIAYELVDSRIVRIPRVYAFFSDARDWGYIVMEFVEGKVIDPLEDVRAIEKVADVLQHFATLGHTIPGSLCRGFCRGLLFPETQDLIFDSLDEMETWFNSRLFEHNPKLSFRDCQLVLCHLDIAPRNLLWQDDGSLCLLDWGSAGYYPRLFEFCAQWVVEGTDGSFNSVLLNSMNPLPDTELGQREAILCAWRNIQKYPFQSKKVKEYRMASRNSSSLIPVPPPPMPEYPPDWNEQNMAFVSTRPASTASLSAP
ncbi:kinase-like protein [Aspergillus indologenus CBS 114.80]|uniref:Kinase-like protein n=1 Tax=Aspergillus indologenus CBS 114.80 TaxID=1450541 RepID=A0A2V5ICP6_9EURO|nr:kinase-like protein [Aspergillus indologenus CBS 114.80]